jgi:hypothetical protein
MVFQLHPQIYFRGTNLGSRGFSLNFAGAQAITPEVPGTLGCPPQYSNPIFTVAGWVNPDSGSLNASLHGVLTLRATPQTVYHTILGTIGSKPCLFYNNATNIQGGSNLVAGTWYHLCGTLDANGSQLWQSGISVATGAGASATQTVTLIKIGAEPQNQNWNGRIFDVAIWNAKLASYKRARGDLGRRRLRLAESAHRQVADHHRAGAAERPVGHHQRVEPAMRVDAIGEPRTLDR